MKEQQPAADLLQYESQAYAQGFEAVCGVDEAGRGPLAGRVYAAAVILKPGQIIEGVNDSKKLSEKKREALFEVIQKESLSWSIAFATPEEIDEHNILGATFLAMQRAVKGLSVPADCALVDGNRDPQLGIATQTIVKGDSLSASIAAASILAKVARDRYMMEMDKEYPQYKFCQHKGYPTRLHYDMIAVHGICPIHRKSFLKTLGKHLGK